MGDYRKLIAKLAQAPSVAAGNREVAERIAADARRFDPKGTFVVEDTELVVNGLRRRVSMVRNTSPDAGRVEFGRTSGHENSDGRAGLRPLGRAARLAR